MKLSLQEKTYSALGSEKRLEMLRLLKFNKYLTVGQIARTMNLSIQSASQQLKILEAAHIAESSKEGLQVFYAVRKPISPITKSALQFL
jgi:DNA-binding transcriptional ArsR family regulator